MSKPTQNALFKTAGHTRSRSLDILRIGAALWVMTFHWGGNGGFYPLLSHKYPTEWIPQWAEQISHYGFLGVDIFFLLSGSVIAHTALGASHGQFAQKRFLRLVPSYILATVLALIVVPLAVPSINRWVSVVSLSGIHFWEGGYNIVGTAWTLAIEVQFYAFVTLWIWLRKRVEASDMVVGSYFLLAMSIVAPKVNLEWFTFLSLSPWGAYFALGALISVCRGREDLRRHGLGILIAALASGINLYNRLALQWPGTEPRTAVLLSGLVLTVTISFLLWSSFRYRDSVISVGAVNPSSSQSITTLSLMTYPFYLFHVVIGMSILAIAIWQGVPLVTAFAATFMAVVLASWLAAKWFEPWSRRQIAGALLW